MECMGISGGTDRTKVIALVQFILDDGAVGFLAEIMTAERVFKIDRAAIGMFPSEKSNQRLKVIFFHHRVRIHGGDDPAGIVQKAFMALGVGLSLNLLELAGCHASGGNGPTELLALRFYYVIAPILFFMAALGLAWRYPLTQTRQARLQERITRRNARLAEAGVLDEARRIGPWPAAEIDP